jgi:hypothetical protein
VFTGRWCYGTVQIEALEGVLDRANRLHTTRRQAPSAYCQQAEAAFILGKDFDDLGRGVGACGPELVKIRRLKRRTCVSVFFGDWDVAL